MKPTDPMELIADLSDRLRPIVDFEIARGNNIRRIERPAGSNCPLAVIFALPLDIQGFRSKGGLPEDVRIWENRDTHDALEAGYFCEHTHHAVAGPLPNSYQ